MRTKRRRVAAAALSLDDLHFLGLSPTADLESICSAWTACSKSAVVGTGAGQNAERYQRLLQIGRNLRLLLLEAAS